NLSRGFGGFVARVKLAGKIVSNLGIEKMAKTYFTATNPSRRVQFKRTLRCVAEITFQTQCSIGKRQR
ncbi:PIPO, partial [Callistephus mottle virus]